MDLNKAKKVHDLYINLVYAELHLAKASVNPLVFGIQEIENLKEKVKNIKNEIEKL